MFIIIILLLFFHVFNLNSIIVSYYQDLTKFFNILAESGVLKVNVTDLFLMVETSIMSGYLVLSFLCVCPYIIIATFAS